MRSFAHKSLSLALSLALALAALLPASAAAAAAPSWSMSTPEGGMVGSDSYASKVQLLIFYRATLVDGRAMCINSANTIRTLTECDWIRRGDLKVIAADVDGNGADVVSAFKTLYAPNCDDIVFTMNGGNLLWSIVRGMGGGGSVMLAYCAIVDGGEVVDAWAGNYSAEMAYEHLKPVLAQRSKDGWNRLNDAWYYYKDGCRQTGWVEAGGRWYYLNASGVMQTGWVQGGGRWYYLNASGAMQTGWQQLGGKWYYFNADGDMAAGWKQVSGRWYFFGGSGAMQTGWQQLGGKWYYFSGSGAMQTGWVQSGGRWYYLNESGAMQTGWRQIGGLWYYLEGNGAMLADTSRAIGGKIYSFNAAGACLNP